jgi:hypothetical protein
MASRVPGVRCPAGRHGDWELMGSGSLWGLDSLLGSLWGLDSLLSVREAFGAGALWHCLAFYPPRTRCHLLLQLIAQRVLGPFEVVAGLQVQPELRLDAEIAPEA